MIYALLTAMLATVLGASCAFAYHAPTHWSGALRNAVPMVGFQSFYVVGRFVNHWPLTAADAIQVVAWVCISALFGALLARHARLVRSDASDDPMRA